jgi:hypothetical protein
MAPWRADSNVCPRLPFPPVRLLPLAEPAAQFSNSLPLTRETVTQSLQGLPADVYSPLRGLHQAPVFPPDRQLCGNEIRAIYVSSGSVTADGGRQLSGRLR